MVDGALSGASGGMRRAVFTGEARTATVGEARRWAREVLTDWDADALEWELSQLLTEVVTNAVLHAGTPLRVVLTQDATTGLLRCEVSDGSPAALRRRCHSAEATTGRGLQVLESVAASWGVDRTGEGKTVWFEVDGTGDAGLDGEDLAALLADLEPRGGASTGPTDSGAAAVTAPAPRGRARLVGTFRAPQARAA